MRFLTTQFRTCRILRPISVPAVAACVTAMLLAMPHDGSAQDFVEASTTVGSGVLLSEMSFSTDRTKLGGVTYSGTATPTLLAYGFAETWELRFETNGYVRAKESMDNLVLADEAGFFDLSVGVAWHTHDGEPGSAIPSIGWLLHADVAVGSAAFSGTGIRPSLRAVGEWEFPHGIAAGVMPGVFVDADDSGRFAAGMFGAFLAKSWTDAFWTFGEIAVEQLTAANRGGNVVMYNAGAAHMIGESVQVDAVIGVGANDNAPDIVWTFKLAALW
jgi:hypothetical protein